MTDSHEELVVSEEMSKPLKIAPAEYREVIQWTRTGRPNLAASALCMGIREAGYDDEISHLRVVGIYVYEDYRDSFVSFLYKTEVEGKTTTTSHRVVAR